MYSEKDKVYPIMLSIYHDIGIDKQYSYFIMKMDISYLFLHQYYIRSRSIKRGADEDGKTGYRTKILFQK